MASLSFKRILPAAALAVSALIGTTAAKAELQAYAPASGISGNISSVGSDTLANLMTLWAEQFKRTYPNVNIQIQAAGSSTAPPALTEGTSNIGPMSRPMSSKELQFFERRFGYKPTQIRVAIDALAVYVHKDNPIEGLSIPQVDAIFSSTRRCGANESIENWNQLDAGGDLASQRLQLFGRNSVSGTYGYFKQRALCRGDFKNSVNEQPGSASVVQSVSTSLNGIGYSGIGYQTSGVRTVPLSRDGDKFVDATTENALNGTYPLTRFLYIYVNKHPNKPLPPLETEFVKLVLSKIGQEIVVKDGYIPMPESAVFKELEKLK